MVSREVESWESNEVYLCPKQRYSVNYFIRDISCVLDMLLIKQILIIAMLWKIRSLLYDNSRRPVLCFIAGRSFAYISKSSTAHVRCRHGWTFKEHERTVNWEWEYLHPQQTIIALSYLILKQGEYLFIPGCLRRTSISNWMKDIILLVWRQNWKSNILNVYGRLETRETALKLPCYNRNFTQSITVPHIQNGKRLSNMLY